MARNSVQFQKGYGLGRFLADYGTEHKCESVLFRWRWPQGFVCPECGDRGHCTLHTRRLYQCHRCRHQTSLTAASTSSRCFLASDMSLPARHQCRFVCSSWLRLIAHQDDHSPQQ